MVENLNNNCVNGMDFEVAGEWRRLNNCSMYAYVSVKGGESGREINKVKRRPFCGRNIISKNIVHVGVEEHIRDEAGANM